jgi:hypothetical protein
MSNERPRSRIPALFVDHLPTVAGGAMLLWLVVEFAVRRGLARVLSDPLGTTVGAGAVSVTVGFTLAAVGIAWWGTQAGIEPPDWEYTLSRRSPGSAWNSATSRARSSSVRGAALAGQRRTGRAIPISTSSERAMNNGLRGIPPTFYMTRGPGF